MVLAVFAALSVGYDAYRLFAEIFRASTQLRWFGAHILSIIWSGVRSAFATIILQSVFAGSDAPERWKLEIYPEGLTYRFPGGRVQAPWQSFDGIGRVASGRMGADGILLAHGARFPALRILRGVPLSLFDDEWRRGDIGRWVAHYAPQLLQRPWGSIAA